MADEPQTLNEVIAAIQAGRLACSLDPSTMGIRLGLVDGLNKAYLKAKDEYYRMHGMLLSVVIQVAPDWVLAERQAGREPQDYLPEDLYRIIQKKLDELLFNAKEIAILKDAQVVELKAENAALTAKLESGSKVLISQHAAEKKALLAEIQSLKDQLAAAATLASRAQAPVPTEPGGAAEPAFFLRWKAGKHFQRESVALRLMGESGLARVPEIRKRLGEELGIESSSAAISEILAALTESGFVESAAVESGLSGRPPGLLRLTDLGQAAYSLLTNKPPQPSEWDLKKYHKSDSHTLLNLAARDWLLKAGYTIVQDAPVLESGGEKFNPDLAASKNGDLIYVEVETQATKGNQDTAAKWLRFARFSGGRMYVFCENSLAMNKVLKETGDALGPAKLKSVVIHLCNLSKMTDEKLSHFGLWAR